MPSQPPKVDPLRIAVVSTPRSGNTWFRTILARWYDIPDSSSHEIKDDDWAKMPREVVHQIHWNRTPEFLAKLDENGFRVATMARHPLDTLISILHFAWYDEETSCWLLGRGGNESVIRGAMPRSRVFLDYAASERVAGLLSVSADWWQKPGVVSVRYEDLVRDPVARLEALSSDFGPPRHESVDGVLEAGSMERQRKFSFNNHFWKGRPGLWRELIPAAEAFEIAGAIAPVLETLGYVVDPDPNLTPADADRNWVRYVGEELIATVRKNTLSFRTQVSMWDARTREAFQARDAALASAEAAARERDGAIAEAARLGGELAETRTVLDRTNEELRHAAASRDHHVAELYRAHAELTETHARLGPALVELETLRPLPMQVEKSTREVEHLTRELEAVRGELEPFRRLGAGSIRLAKAIQGLRDRHPRLDAMLKRLKSRLRRSPNVRETATTHTHRPAGPRMRRRAPSGR